MKLSIVLPLAAIVLTSLCTTLFIAKLAGRSVRLWFWIGLGLPIISWLILLSLPVKTESIPVTREEDDLFDQVF